MGSNTEGMEVLGRPIQKHQVWMSNFDLHPLDRGCRDAKAIMPSTHTHQHARGSMKLPDGRWMSVAGYSGKYPEALAAVYGCCLANANVANKCTRNRPLQETELKKLADGMSEGQARRSQRAAVLEPAGQYAG